MKKIKNRDQEKRKIIGYFCVSFFLTLLFIASVGGILIVNINSRNTGWNDIKTVLAFSASDKSIDISVMGNKLQISQTPFTVSKTILQGIQRGYSVIEPSPMRLASEIIAAIQNK